MQIQHVGNTWYFPPSGQWAGDIARPGGVQEGDLLLLVTTCDGYGPGYYWTGVESGGPWNYLYDHNPHGGVRTQVWWKYATAAEPTSYHINSATNQNTLYFNQPKVQAFLHAYRGVDSVDAIIASALSANGTTPSVTTDEKQATNVLFWASSPYYTTGTYAQMPAGVTQRAARVPDGSRNGMWLGDVAQPQIGPSSTYTLSNQGPGTETALTISLRSENSAPNAPGLISPSGAVTLDREQAQIFDWTYSDPDPEDSQAEYELRYRLTGSSTWTTVSATTPSTEKQFAANTFAIGDYEWQVRTTDQRGLVGPWSASAFFSAAEIPKDVTITSPTNGGTIGTDTFVLEWSTLNQDSYQIRKVADLAGVPDTATVYYDSGIVADANARALILTFPTNSRYEHLQLRVEKDGLWSAWVSVRVLVSYVPPALPTVTLTAEDATASLLIAVDNPAPVGDEPLVTENEVFLDEGSGEVRVVVLPPSGSWRYWTPKPNFDYANAVRVKVNGDNGTSTST